MVISGEFKDYNNRTVTVTITTPTQGTDIVIGGDIVKFAKNPVTITDNVNDTFDVFIYKSATINLVTRQYLGQLLFANNARSISVEITRGNDVLFSGFVDPNTYNQPFTSPLDEFEINCIDKLSTLQYYNYKNINYSNFNTIKQSANNVTFKSILDDALSGLTFNAVYYDKSKGVASNRTNQCFTDITVSELKMIGESIDDVWTRDKALEEMLKYLNLHIKQDGNNIYIFDWESIRSRKTSWRNLKTSANATLSTSEVTLTNTMHSDRSTNISIADVYNQVSLTCDLDEQETVVESPLEKDELTSLYTGKQLYMTEYISEGSGDRANNAFNNMVQGNATDYDKAKEIDWYIQAMTNSHWKFYYNGTNTVESLAEVSGNKCINQWKLAKYLKENSCVPYIFRMGSVEHQASATDNSPTSKIDMTNYLYISINGNEDDTANGTAPTEATIRAHSGMCEYIGNSAGGTFSPTDSGTTNYLVFSGKVLLQPLAYESDTDVATYRNNFERIRLNGASKTEGSDAKVPYYTSPLLNTSNLVKSENNNEGRYYTRKFYTQENPTDQPSTYLTDTTCGVQPWTADKSAKGYQYNYTSDGDGTDRYSKLPILECELIIGNKRLIETNIDQYGNSTFEWVTVGQEPTETVDGVTYTITTFSLGVNPKIGDYIIGQEFDIQNTIDYTMNLDMEGTAIPIKQSDNVSGAVLFRILGPINLTWNQVTRRHPSFWRHTQWNSNTRSILAHTESIIIKDFECKITTDNGLNETFGDADLIYMSDETDEYITKKDDIDFHWITQLTSQECREKGIPQSVNLNATIRSSTNAPLTGVFNYFETDSNHKVAKAEEHYINQYYLEYCQPKIIMQTELHEEIVNWRRTYVSNALTKSFFVLSVEENIRECTSNIILKEI